MTEGRILGALAPFRVRSFRFQWPADLLTSWAFEMETLILGWYVLVETGSVVWLTAFASLQFLGTLIAPMFGVMGDRLGRRTMLCLMRAAYAVFAAIIMILSLNGILAPVYVFAVAICTGLVRPSDLVMRNALIGDTIPMDKLMNAMGVSRTTMDSARIAGALIGAGMFAQLGIAYAYVTIVVIYCASLALTLGVAGRGHAGQEGSGAAAGEAAAAPAVSSPWRDLRAGLAYARGTPVVLALLLLAFLVNFTAYPITHGLMPYVAREIYLVDENGLGRLLASFAAGALLGSLFMTFSGQWRHPGKFMFVGIWVWFALLLVFAQMASESSGALVLFITGLGQSMAMIAMSVTLIGNTEPPFRGRILGVRMLAVYGLPLGLFGSSGLIVWLGFPATATLYGCLGLAGSAFIAFKWREKVWL